MEFNVILSVKLLRRRRKFDFYILVVYNIIEEMRGIYEIIGEYVVKWRRFK